MSAAAEKKRGLGRGLDALFGDAEEKVTSQEAPRAPTIAANTSTTAISAQRLPLTALIPSPLQPRQRFDEAALQALSESIRAHGILQPLLVRKAPGQESKYEIIAGERRWRAAQIAQLHEVPIVIQQLDDRAALEIGLIENIQREDLSAIEEAEAYQKLMNEFGHTQEALAEIVGKSRSHLANTMRLLQLPKSLRDKVHSGALSAGHARQLLGLPEKDMMTLAAEVIKHDLSVRETERRHKKILNPSTTRAPLSAIGKKISATEKDADVVALEQEMGKLLGLRVDINSKDNASGTLNIHYASLDQLDELLQKLTRAAR